ncbi:MAG TPA: prephenate dehydrogenase/arogenate dehydrogenase family protein [Pirellulales bacterium]|nr:prephenate dehydrogenase/arogenate dehydrogenase family protein [Pirellulales bacterium]
MNRQFDTIAILGVGLIGGSIGLAVLRRGLASRVIGVGRRIEGLRMALEMGAITSFTLAPAEGVAEADLVVVCTPVGRIADDVRTVARHCRSGTLITDVGSTKGAIVAEVGGSLPGGVQFIGSHPLAGSERSGAAAAEVDLFVDRVVVLTPSAATQSEDLERLGDFWRSLGARVVTMSAEEHDRALAITSHLPHLVASALAASTPQELLQLTATGWADTTRIAAGDADLWRQIFASNRDSLLASLSSFEQQLASFRAALEGRDDDGLVELLAAAKRRRDTA